MNEAQQCAADGAAELRMLRSMGRLGLETSLTMNMYGQPQVLALRKWYMPEGMYKKVDITVELDPYGQLFVFDERHGKCDLNSWIKWMGNGYIGV